MPIPSEDQRQYIPIIEKPLVSFGTYDGDSNLPTNVCGADGCGKSERLMKCVRCKAAFYCSKECQKSSWPRHKEQCNFSRAIAPPIETPLNWNLRYFTARFTPTLITAAVIGLELVDEPANIDKYALVLTITPRPADHEGARFAFESVFPVPIDQVVSLYGQDSKAAGEATLAQHARERVRLRASTGGQSDYSAAVVVARNKGPHAIPGDDAIAVRFKPLCIDSSAKRLAMSVKNVDWIYTLQMQIDENFPMRGMAAHWQTESG